MTEVRPKCPECGHEMMKSGMVWSGRHKVRRWKCNNCGRSVSGTPKEEKK